MEFISARRNSTLPSQSTSVATGTTSSGGNFKVAVRVRPLIDREIKDNAQEVSIANNKYTLNV